MTAKSAPSMLSTIRSTTSVLNRLRTLPKIYARSTTRDSGQETMYTMKLSFALFDLPLEECDAKIKDMKTARYELDKR